MTGTPVPITIVCASCGESRERMCVPGKSRPRFCLECIRARRATQNDVGRLSFRKRLAKESAKHAPRPVPLAERNTDWMVWDQPSYL